jgi:hypothetical protein
MKARGAAIQGGLAAVGLLAVYGTWQREPERAPGEVVILEGAKSDVKKLRYSDEGKWVELERGDGAVWVKVSANAERKTPERKLRGNESAERLLEKFGPLKATRALGALAADKLKEFGLDAPKKKIEVDARGQKVTLAVGVSPFGVSDPYVKDERDGRVYVLGGAILSDLDAAAVRLVDRQLHTFQPGDYDAIAITAGGKKRELLVVGGGAGAMAAAAKLASKKSPDKPDELAKNWHDKVWRAMVVDVLGAHEIPPTGAPTVALRVDYTSKGKEKGFIEIGRTQAAPSPTNVVAPGAPDLFARTEHTAGWVKLPTTLDELLKEAEKVAATD